MSQISDDVLEVLKRGESDNRHFRITTPLDRKLYLKVNQHLKALGGKWSRTKKAHVFTELAAPLIGDVVATGKYIDAKTLYQFYETPAWLATKMLHEAEIEGDMTVLEPSAGRGTIALAAREAGAQVSCVEIQSKLCDDLFNLGFLCLEQDFLTVVPREFPYNAVLMNPPFTRGQDMKHVAHAYRFLKQGGVLVAIMSPAWTFRMDRRAVRFREWAEIHAATWEPLPDGTFRESGTMVKTGLFKIRKQEK